MRSGDEPVHARSPLRLRLGLALLGLVSWSVAAVVLAWRHDTFWALVCAVGVLLASANCLVIVLRLRAGPHWQPGPQIPPYRPAEPGPEDRAPRGHPAAPAAVRMRRYLLLMGLCVLLVVTAWAWVWRFSMTAALMMSLAAMVIPPVAAVIANLGSNVTRPDPGVPPGGPDGTGRPPPATGGPWRATPPSPRS